jgi:hypothetical protein
VLVRWNHFLRVFTTSPVTYGVDGTTMLIPDTADDGLVFGRPHSGRSAGAYPQLRLVALMVLRAHLLADIVPGSYYTGEQTLAQELWKRSPRTLGVGDRLRRGKNLHPEAHRNPTQQSPAARAAGTVGTRHRLQSQTS